MVKLRKLCFKGILLLNLTQLLEWLRYLCAALGFYFAYQPNMNAIAGMHSLLLWVVIPLAGLTGVESLLFSEKAAHAKQREIGSAYQIQSAMNNLAIAITSVIIWRWQWGFYAELAMLFTLFIFFILSSIQHAYEFLFTPKKQLIHLLRPILTIILITATIPIFVNSSLDAGPKGRNPGSVAQDNLHTNNHLQVK